jgi:hypothetical protein
VPIQELTLESAAVDPVPASNRGKLGMEHGKNVKKFARARRGGAGGRVVIMASLASLERFQAQPKGKMSVRAMSAATIPCNVIVDRRVALRR